MGFSKEKKETIKKYILERINYSESPYEKTLDLYNISRQTINKYLNELEAEGIITISGGKTNRNYSLKIHRKEFGFEISSEIDEQDIFDDYIKQLIVNEKENVKRIIEYSFTEMVNNALDHSKGTKLKIVLYEDYFNIAIRIIDNGVGIFKKIMDDHNLENEEEAIFELAKGKLTSDTNKHSGEGIFFTSRAVDEFYIYSGEKVFKSHEEKDMVEKHEFKNLKGTAVDLIIKKNNSLDLTELFKNYTDDDYNFNKTEIKIKMAESFSDTLMSRSQAKRVLNRIEKFKMVTLDFSGVKIIGQGFADEIFRIFLKNHPEIKIKCVNCNEDVEFMIQRAKKTIL